MITAPFNFVPLSEKVFFPDWADSVSHDIPFEDTQSGSIDITITAKSPIFIRDHEKKEEFCQYIYPNGEKQYYIPATSVKGMVRNVLEIMSFSKMGKDSYNDDTYAVRDLRNRELYMSKMTPDKTFCGWLKKSEDGKGYIIEDCGKPGRIKHEEIDKIYHMNFASKFKHGTFGNKAKDKTAKFKYELIKDKNFTHNFSYFKKDVNREIYRYHEHGKSKGTLVLTGQPSARNEPQGRKPSGKVYEFIFFEPKDELKVSQKSMEDFLFAYFDKRTTEPKESPDWTFWKKKLEDESLPKEERKVPIFFQKNGKEVLHFGLSYLYKLPYTHSVKDGIPPAHNDERKDLAQTIFGYIGESDALKGRVQFSHFQATSNVKVMDKTTEILGTPRASYYPMYVKQKGKLFTTFMDNSFSISGRKRYPIHKNGVKKTEDTGNENVGTTFIPLDKGVIFKGKLRYHNLKKAELGALLSALTFHDTKGCFHNIGMAKSLGYGKIELKIDGIEIREFLKAFETELTTTIPNWVESEQLTELLTMAKEQDNSGRAKLEYMKLKDFASNKTGDKDYLRNYSEFETVKKVSVKSLISEEDLEALKLEQAKREEAEKKALAQESAWRIVSSSTNIATIENFIKDFPESRYVSIAKEKIAQIEKEKEDEESFKKEQEASEKWDAVQKVDAKYKQRALKDFIEKFHYSLLVEKAEEELAKLERNELRTPKGFDFSQADDIKSLERAIKPILNPSEEDKKKLEEAIVRIYPKLNAKKKKQFAKSKLIVKWLGKDRFDKVLYPDLETLKELQVDFETVEILNLSGKGIKLGTISDEDEDGEKTIERFDEIPNELSKFKNLKELYFSSNELYEFPESILELTNLEVLDLSYNYIERIPESLVGLKKLRVLKLESNPIFNLNEISSLKPQQLILALLSTQNQAKRNLNEAKVLVLGHGGVGKTSLVNCIVDKKIDTTSTFGIEIGSHVLSNKVKINIWDFAGQEITHQMHKFFLSKRSIYLLVLNARTEESAMTWLEDIQERAGNAPIIIVVNKIDENRGFSLSKNKYEKKFPDTIKKIIYTSAKLGEEENIQELIDELELQTDNLQIVKDELPEAWFAVKEELEKQYKNRSNNRKSNIVTRDSFEDICERYNIEDENEQDSLLTILKQIGTITDHLGSENIALMNPNWITHALYKILRCSDDDSNDVEIDNGVLNVSDENLNKILGNDKRYKKRDYQDIVNLLIKFEIAFRLNDNEILIASEISSNEPSYDYRYYERGLRLRYKYTYKLKKERFAKFIVKAKDYISLEEEVPYWSDGVFLKYNESEVVVQREDDAILVLFHSKDKYAREFLSIIRHIFRELNSDTTVREEIPLIDEEDENKKVVGYTRYTYILEQEAKGEEKVTFDVESIGSMDFKIDDLLDGYREEELKPLIITEGKTDKRILEIAWKKLYPSKNIPFDIEVSGVEIEEEKKQGNADLVKRALELDKHIDRIIIGIFDNDNEGNSQFKGLKKKVFEDYNINNFIRKHLIKPIYAILLPPPNFRRKFVHESDVGQRCFVIEHYFSNEVLEKNQMKGNSLYGSEMFKVNNGKDNFSKAIEKLEKEEFKHFKLLFDRIEKIIEEAK